MGKVILKGSIAKKVEPHLENYINLGTNRKYYYAYNILNHIGFWCGWFKKMKLRMYNIILVFALDFAFL